MQTTKLTLMIIISLLMCWNTWAGGKSFSMTGQSSQSFTMARKAAESQARSICGRIVFRQTSWNYTKSYRGRVFSAQARFLCGHDDFTIHDSPFGPAPIGGTPFPAL